MVKSAREFCVCGTFSFGVLEGFVFITLYTPLFLSLLFEYLKILTAYVTFPVPN